MDNIRELGTTVSQGLEKEAEFFWDPKQIKRAIMEDGLFLAKLWSAIDLLWAVRKEANPDALIKHKDAEIGLEELYKEAFSYRVQPTLDDKVAIAVKMRQIANEAGIALKYFTQDNIEKIALLSEEEAAKKLAGISGEKIDEKKYPFTARQTLHDYGHELARRGDEALKEIIFSTPGLMALYQDFKKEAEEREADAKKPKKQPELQEPPSDLQSY